MKAARQPRTLTVASEPATDETGPRRRLTAPGDAGAERGDGVVLVVDDDDDLRALVAEVLLQAGYAVATAADGEAALVYLNDHAAPALILLDFMMPRLDGCALLARLRAEPRWAAVPVVICTASGRRDPRLRALAGVPVLDKPFSSDALLAAVTQHGRTA